MILDQSSQPRERTAVTYIVELLLIRRGGCVYYPIRQGKPVREPTRHSPFMSRYPENREPSGQRTPRPYKACLLTEAHHWNHISQFHDRIAGREKDTRQPNTFQQRQKGIASGIDREGAAVIWHIEIP